jgi:hypothetical protein
MSSLNVPTGAESLSKTPVLGDTLALEALKKGANPKVQAGIDKLINSNRSFFDKAIEFLSDEKNEFAKSLIENNGGATVELVDKVAAMIREQSIKDDKERRFRAAGRQALARAKAGTNDDGLGPGPAAAVE